MIDLTSINKDTWHSWIKFISKNRKKDIILKKTKNKIVKRGVTFKNLHVCKKYLASII